ncbi:MAG TPA: sigma-70 family RNA polymerase sigma factor, partial [Candidatus Solibacter sp.]|nr:sigma-70 family RNA polymerase sigma factor [Candidatus Solibacter sp.]
LARKGDQAAFADLYYRHRRPVFQFAWRLTRSEASAEDVTQECFLALLDGASYDAAHGALRTYLLGIARHRALRRMRLWEREAPGIDDAPAAADTLGAMLASERAAMVEQAIASLPLAQREALILFEYEDLSLEEIAEVTGSEPGAIKARLFRARESLRRKLAPIMAASPARGIA